MPAWGGSSVARVWQSQFFLAHWSSEVRILICRSCLAKAWMYTWRLRWNHGRFSMAARFFLLRRHTVQVQSWLLDCPWHMSKSWYSMRPALQGPQALSEGRLSCFRRRQHCNKTRAERCHLVRGFWQNSRSADLEMLWPGSVKYTSTNVGALPSSQLRKFWSS